MKIFLKHIFVIYFLLLFSCENNSPKKNDIVQKTNDKIKFDAIDKDQSNFISELKKEQLIDSVLKQLNLDYSQLEIQFLVAEKRLINPSETILIIPEYVNAEEEGYDFIINSHIIIANSITGSIKNQITERWTSDAVMLTEASIDTSSFWITDKINAFGIRTKERTQSQPNPYNNENLSLYIKSGDSLKRILNYLDINTFSGEWNTFCEGTFLNTQKNIKMSKEKTNDFYNILVESKNTTTINYKDRNDKCQSKDTISNHSLVLKYNGKNYKKIEYDYKGFNEIINEIQFKVRPIVDTTNFDNLFDVKYFNPIIVNALQLEKIYPNFYTENYDYKASASYRINISTNFYTLVFIIYKGDNEIESILINYDLDGFIIDSKVIAYDEIAEGMSSIESKIELNKISIKTILWIDEKEEGIENFIINDKGIITPLEGN